jgi:hypothetical protein
MATAQLWRFLKATSASTRCLLYIEANRTIEQAQRKCQPNTPKLSEKNCGQRRKPRASVFVEIRDSIKRGWLLTHRWWLKNHLASSHELLLLSALLTTQRLSSVVHRGIAVAQCEIRDLLDGGKSNLERFLVSSSRFVLRFSRLVCAIFEFDCILGTCSR